MVETKTIRQLEADILGMLKSIYKILVVDDDKLMQDLLTDRLSREKIFQIFVANNGQEGLYSAFSNTPDLILLDVQMPVMDGVTMMKELRKDPRGKDTKVIFLTNFDTNERVLQEISECKPAFYLIKSNTSMDELTKRVKETLGIWDR